MFGYDYDDALEAWTCFYCRDVVLTKRDLLAGCRTLARCRCGRYGAQAPTPSRVQTRPIFARVGKSERLR